MQIKNTTERSGRKSASVKRSNKLPEKIHEQSQSGASFERGSDIYSANVPEEDLRVYEENFKKPDAPIAPISGAKHTSQREDIDGVTSSHD